MSMNSLFEQLYEALVLQIRKEDAELCRQGLRAALKGHH